MPLGRVNPWATRDPACRGAGSGSSIGTSEMTWPNPLSSRVGFGQEFASWVIPNIVPPFEWDGTWPKPKSWVGCWPDPDPHAHYWCRVRSLILGKWPNPTQPASNSGLGLGKVFWPKPYLVVSWIKRGLLDWLKMGWKRMVKNQCWDCLYLV